MLTRSLTRGLARNLTRGLVRGEEGPVDPLAGIDFVLRLQTHRSDNVPFGLYQDTACTIPAVADGDPIGGWKDEISGSGLIAVQSVADKQPTLRYTSGKPVVRFDGVDDTMQISGATWPASPFWGAGIDYTAASNFVRIVGFGAYLTPREVALGTWFNSQYRLTTNDDMILSAAVPDCFLAGRYDPVAGDGEISTDETIFSGALTVGVDVTTLPLNIAGLPTTSSSQVDISSIFVASSPNIGTNEFSRIVEYANLLRV